MKEKKVNIRLLVTYAICFVVLFLGALGLSFSKDLWHQHDAREIFNILTDMFTIPGILMLCLWGLSFASDNGAMDGVVYGVRHFFSMLIPGGPRKDPKSYYDYLEERRARKHPGTKALLISGAVFFAIGMIFLVLFLRLDV